MSFVVKCIRLFELKFFIEVHTADLEFFDFQVREKLILVIHGDGC